MRVARRHAWYHNPTRGAGLVLKAAQAPPPRFERAAVEVPVQDAAAAPPDSNKQKTVRFNLKATLWYDNVYSKEDLDAAAKEAHWAAKMEAATRCRPPRVFEEETYVEKLAAANTKKNSEKYMP